MEKFKNKDENKKENSFIKIVKGSIISLIITLTLLFITAIILAYTNVSENIIPVAIIVISAISILIGSILSTTHIKRNGILNGALVGAIYMIVIYLLSSITITGFYINTRAILMLSISIIAGIIGGIIGVNFNK